MKCPDRQMLLEFSSGKAPVERAEPIARHVESCRRCQAILNQASIGADPLLKGLRQAKHVLDGAASTTAAASPPDARTPDAAALDFLAPAQSAGELGRLGTYRVLRTLGQGGMGMVLLAEDTLLDRRVALKVMLPKLAQDASAKQRFLREAKSAAAIEHDHIVQIYQVGEDRGVPFLAMQLLSGLSLEDMLRRAGWLAIRQVVRLGAQIAAGLAAAHARGLVHRDIKPANIWIEDKHGGRVKLLDFGLARSVEGDPGLTQTGAILGTPAYMPPEQARGAPVDHRCDLYALGCVLYRMATGALPIKGKDTIAILMALARDKPTPPRQLNPEIPESLDQLILALLAKEAARRPASADLVQEALRKIERDLKQPGPARAPNPPTEPLKPDAIASTSDTAVVTKGAARPQASSDRAAKGRESVRTHAADRARQRRLHSYAFAALAVVGVVGILATFLISWLRDLPSDLFSGPIGGAPGNVKPESPAIGAVNDPAPATFVPPAAPVEPWALQFDGVDDFVSLPMIPHDGKEPLTIEAWVTPTAEYPEPTPEQGMFLRGHIFGWENLQDLTLAAFRNDLGACIITALPPPQQGVGLHPLIRPDLRLHRRQHLALTVENGQHAALYIDGQRIKALQLPKPIVARSSPPSLGALLDSASKPARVFAGRIDEAGLYRTIRYRDNFVPPERFPEKDALALFHFDEGAGPTLTDSSGNGNHGRIVGAQWVRNASPSLTATPGVPSKAPPPTTGLPASKAVQPPARSPTTLDNLTLLFDIHYRNQKKYPPKVHTDETRRSGIQGGVQFIEFLKGIRPGTTAMIKYATPFDRFRIYVHFRRQGAGDVMLQVRRNDDQTERVQHKLIVRANNTWLIRREFLMRQDGEWKVHRIVAVTPDSGDGLFPVNPGEWADVGIRVMQSDVQIIVNQKPFVRFTDPHPPRDPNGPWQKPAGVGADTGDPCFAIGLTAYGEADRLEFDHLRGYRIDP